MSPLPLIRWVAIRLLLALVIGFLLGMAAFGIVSCAASQHSQAAPHPSRRYYEQQQHGHARERRQDRRVQKHSHITWSGR